jgi:two-component system, NarL family, sensor kinase
VRQSSPLRGPSPRPRRPSAVDMSKEPQKPQNWPPLEELFAQFPRGIALLELPDPAEVSAWRLVAINDIASNIVVPSIQTFLSATQLRLGEFVDLPELYKDVLLKRRPRVVGIVQARGSRPRHERLYTMSAFPVGACRVGISFEDAHSLLTGPSARVLAERQLSQTCEFVGAILWRADPQTLQFTYVSPQAQAILGYWLERWSGETNFWKKHLALDDRERVAAVCEKIVRGGKRQDFEFRMISVHDQTLWFHAAAELSYQGRRPELVGVMNDITDLKRAEERIRALTSRMMRVQDDERRRISRELHDSLGQYLTSVKINVELVKRESPGLNETHRALLAESSQTLERCVQEVRSVSYVLHPPLLDELGLLSALRWYAGGFAERSGVHVNLNVPHEFSRLPDEMELAIFRIVQESLTNIQRHSRSDVAWVRLSEHEDRAEIQITDTGVGIPGHVVERITQGKTLEGVGLRGMYERVRELGGRLEIESTGMGTAVSAVLPLRRGEADQDKEREERKARVAGKPLESSELHIEGMVSGRNGAGEAKRVERQEFRSTRPSRRRPSRRST